MELMQVIIKPYLTEKTYSVRNGSKKEVITLVVHPKANKHDIKKAFKAIYEVEIESINTITKKPALIRTGTKNPGLTKLTKIAYITLPEGVNLAITNDEIQQAKEELKESKIDKKDSKEIKKTKATVKK